ncbi:hypothetical protein [Actinocatenispora thailandica]|uniref:hypothetical protein n=1 Tax=Actinocatenispora thailandica TaxID=227318 RepID=UPI0019502BF3|nr:hypothetical protein [Actinocatenispora thailandica]
MGSGALRAAEGLIRRDTRADEPALDNATVSTTESAIAGVPVSPLTGAHRDRRRPADGRDTS